MRVARKIPGFTLIELVVAIIVVAILAGVILPRLLSTGEREARAEAEAVASLLGAAARRAALTTQPIAIDYADGQFRVMMLRAKDTESFTPDNMVWVPEMLLPTLQLSTLSLVSATQDTAALSPRSWRVELGGDVRPELLVNLEDPRRRLWTILLSPDAEGALLMDDRQLIGGAGQIVDLDRAGRGMAAW
jgi:prepilin-type N-terminal cleavage/methylation domain-containing protein